MMKFLRKKGVMKFLLWAIAGVVILSFGLLGNAYLLKKNPNEISYAGKIFGRKISLEDFNRNYQFVVMQARLQYGKNFDQVAPMLKLEDQAWNRIILLEQARRQRIRVSDKEVIDSIHRFPFFYNQNTKKFDPEVYRMIVNRSFRMSTRAFEEGMRDSLKIFPLFERQTFAVTVSEDDIAEAYKRVNEKIKVSYVLFPLTDFLKNVKFDEIKAKNYFLDHKKDFIQPPAINVFYVRFPFKADQEESKSKAYDKAYNILSSLHNGDEFSAAANASNVKIQETGFFDPQKPDLSTGWSLEVFQQLLNMHPGQYSDIITTDNSYDILQLREIRPPFLPSYAQVKDKVKTAWVEHAALKFSKDKTLELLPAFQTGEDFTAVAKKQGLTIHQTPDFNFGQYLQDLGPAPLFQQTAFSLTKENPISNAVETEKGYVILHLDKRIPVNMEKFNKEKDAFGQQLLMGKKMKVFERYIQTLREKADLKDLIPEQNK